MPRRRRPMEKRSRRGEMGLAFRLATRVILNPPLTASLLALLTLVAGLSPRQGSFFLYASFAGPWVFLGLFILCLPLLGAVRDRFKLPEATRRNHALEHGTIHFLRARYGPTRKVTGSSSDAGFRVAGVRSESDILKAFEELSTRLAAGDDSSVVATGCGSMIVTALAFSIGTFSLAGLAFLLLHPSPTLVILTTSILLLAVILLRYPLGRWIQRHRFLSLDFQRPRIIAIVPVAKADIHERHPVFFVRTRYDERTSR